MRIVCVGDCGIDHYLPSGDRYAGGITANFAMQARRTFPVGDRIHLISPLGNDDGAELVRDAFDNTGIDCHFASLVGATPVQYIEIEPDGEKRFVSYEEGVLRNFQLGVAEADLIASSDLLVAPVYLQIVGVFDELMTIETQGIVAIDFADFLQHPDFSLLERHIEHIDIGFFGLSINDTEAMTTIAQFAKAHGKLFIVTLGAYGSHAYSGDSFDACPAVPVDNVVDTTGAGDAFAAGFLGQYCHGAGIPRSLEAGATSAAEVIQRRGVGPAQATERPIS